MKRRRTNTLIDGRQLLVRIERMIIHIDREDKERRETDPDYTGRSPRLHELFGARHHLSQLQGVIYERLRDANAA